MWHTLPISSIEIDKAIKRGHKPSVIAQLKKLQEQEDERSSKSKAYTFKIKILIIFCFKLIFR
ncbi:hypothetical protein B7R76_04295 [Mageeibacillus indolicus]|uniref:Uncharacterized protein n=1 Tax=Mageeibacillus indolicus TaxID=884684 RepID=A0A2J8B1Z3_9FIRM|nr:hypothetical protein B7R76_04295 [Mageeibacillus indolicus]